MVAKGTPSKRSKNFDQSNELQTITRFWSTSLRYHILESISFFSQPTFQFLMYSTFDCLSSRKFIFLFITFLLLVIPFIGHNLCLLPFIFTNLHAFFSIVYQHCFTCMLCLRVCYFHNIFVYLFFVDENSPHPTNLLLSRTWHDTNEESVEFRYTCRQYYKAVSSVSLFSYFPTFLHSPSTTILCVWSCLSCNPSTILEAFCLRRQCYRINGWQSVCVSVCRMCLGHSSPHYKSAFSTTFHSSNKHTQPLSITTW